VVLPGIFTIAKALPARQELKNKIGSGEYLPAKPTPGCSRGNDFAANHGAAFGKSRVAAATFAWHAGEFYRRETKTTQLGLPSCSVWPAGVRRPVVVSILKMVTLSEF
jgi:hypothetical protein